MPLKALPTKGGGYHDKNLPGASLADRFLNLVSQLISLQHGLPSLFVHKAVMVKSSDIARDHQEVEADRIRDLVRQHEAQKRRKLEPLPGAGLFGFVAGWLLMAWLDQDRKE
jgi:hypothetical protein